MALITFWTGNIGLFVEGVVEVGKLKKKIKHDEPPFVSPVLKSADRHRLAVTTAQGFANCSRTTSRSCTIEKKNKRRD
jgi:hypothetical protein